MVVFAAEIKKIIFERGGSIMSKFCRNCGSTLSDSAKFCRSCGTETQVAIAKTLAVPSVGEAATMTENAAFAPASAGEVCFVHVLPQYFSTATGPFKCLIQGLTGLLRGFGATFKDKKRWIPALILAFSWFILTLLPLLGINPSPVRWLSFLTFAQGGTTGGIAGLIGGVIGKGVVAYFLMSLVLPLNRGQKPFAGITGGLKQFFPAMGTKNPKQFALLLGGAGAALIGYSFMTGAVSLQNSMTGIAAFFLSLRALSDKAGFLRRFLLSFSQKAGANSISAGAKASRLVAGWTAGFALGIVLSALKIGKFSLLSGAILLAAAIVLGLIVRDKREVAL